MPSPSHGRGAIGDGRSTVDEDANDPFAKVGADMLRHSAAKAQLLEAVTDLRAKYDVLSEGLRLQHRLQEEVIKESSTARKLILTLRDQLRTERARRARLELQRQAMVSYQPPSALWLPKQEQGGSVPSSSSHPTRGRLFSGETLSLARSGEVDLHDHRGVRPLQEALGKTTDGDEGSHAGVVPAENRSMFLLPLPSSSVVTSLMVAPRTSSQPAMHANTTAAPPRSLDRRAMGSRAATMTTTSRSSEKTLAAAASDGPPLPPALTALEDELARLLAVRAALSTDLENKRTALHGGKSRLVQLTAQLESNKEYIAANKSTQRRPVVVPSSSQAEKQHPATLEQWLTLLRYEEGNDVPPHPLPRDAAVSSTTTTLGPVIIAHHQQRRHMSRGVSSDTATHTVHQLRYAHLEGIAEGPMGSAQNVDELLSVKDVGDLVAGAQRCVDRQKRALEELQERRNRAEVIADWLKPTAPNTTIGTTAAAVASGGTAYAPMRPTSPTDAVVRGPDGSAAGGPLTAAASAPVVSLPFVRVS